MSAEKDTKKWFFHVLSASFGLEANVEQMTCQRYRCGLHRTPIIEAKTVAEVLRVTSSYRRNRAASKIQASYASSEVEENEEHWSCSML